MKISLVSLHTSPSEVAGQGDAGGLNVVVREAAVALAAAGHAVTVFTRASGRVAAGEQALSGAQATVRLVALEAGNAQLRKEHLPALLPQLSAQLATHPVFSASDVVHAHYWLSGVAALHASGQHRIPLASTLHTVAAQKNAHLAPGDRPEPAERIEGERLLAQATTIIAGSSSELRGIAEGYSEPTTTAHVVHPGVDTELFAPTDAGAAPASHELLTLTVLGRVQPLKGQDLAVKAVAALLVRFPELQGRVRLVIAGEPTPGQEPYLREVRHLAAARAVDVQFLPAQDRASAAALLRHSDLVLIPSHSETFGLVALEAAASGTPVVASRTTGLIEAVTETSGVLVEGRSPEAWADAIGQLLTNREQLARLSRSSRSHALAHSWHAHAHSLSRVYEMMRNLMKHSD